MILEEITNADILESKQYECKARLNRDDYIGWLKTIPGFANAKGGVFYIGVEDKTNKLIGFDKKDADEERNYFNNMVNQHIFPVPEYSIDFLKYTNNGKELFLLVIEISEALKKPIILKDKGIPSIYLRREGFTNGATYEEIIRMAQSSEGVQYDKVSTDVPFCLKDFSGMAELYKKKTDNDLTESLLLSHGFFDKKTHCLTKGALLFRDGSQDSCNLQCALYNGLTAGDDRIVTINKYNGNILEAIKAGKEFIASRMNHGFLKTKDGRIDTYAYPEIAIHEAVVNAFAHRDYYLKGTQVQIDMFRDRLEISSPGSFYLGDNIVNRFDLTGIVSNQRNVLICNILFLLRQMEGGATGFDKIADAYKNADNRHKPFVYSTSDHFTLTLPDLTFEQGIVLENISLNYVRNAPGSKYDDKILSYCYNFARRAKEIADYLEISNSTYFRETILAKLVASNLLTKEENTKTPLYKTNLSNVHSR
ncbi:MAG: putative DNA binding domain-containing protein [Bacilli bacterium]|jgi:predicted HTH transcriptional regulator|nr:putative DNA binding domain-containing protein [Bacilli bacterium]